MIIDQRFNGPPGSAHGGVASGLFASAIDPRAATVRLVSPPPLGVQLTVEQGEEGVSVHGPGGPVALVRPLEGFDVEPFPWTGADDVAAAGDDWAHRLEPVHPFPTCFGCGPDRPAGDGLELFAGLVSDRSRVVVPWVPDGSLADGGVVTDWAVWAALDCPSGLVLTEDGSADSYLLLGQFSVRIDQSPVAGEVHQIVARPAGQRGRQLFSEVAVVHESGRNLALGRATWISLPRERP